jgi:hypothetical protein
MLGEHFPSPRRRPEEPLEAVSAVELCLNCVLADPMGVRIIIA